MARGPGVSQALGEITQPRVSLRARCSRNLYSNLVFNLASLGTLSNLPQERINQPGPCFVCILDEVDACPDLPLVERWPTLRGLTAQRQGFWVTLKRARPATLQPPGSRCLRRKTCDQLHPRPAPARRSTAQGGHSVLASAERWRWPGAAGQSPIICRDRTRGCLFPGLEGKESSEHPPQPPEPFWECPSR